jgi:hypothetical protein
MDLSAANDNSAFCSRIYALTGTMRGRLLTPFVSQRPALPKELLFFQKVAFSPQPKQPRRASSISEPPRQSWQCSMATVASGTVRPTTRRTPFLARMKAERPLQPGRGKRRPKWSWSGGSGAGAKGNTRMRAIEQRLAKGAGQPGQRAPFRLAGFGMRSLITSKPSSRSAAAATKRISSSSLARRTHIVTNV